nr:ANTAR domain-containing protein [Angustibacter aerolatus]
MPPRGGDRRARDGVRPRAGRRPDRAAAAGRGRRHGRRRRPARRRGGRRRSRQQPRAGRGGRAPGGLRRDRGAGDRACWRRTPGSRCARWRSPRRLQAAALGRQRVGEAVGVLVERHRITPDVAFERLRAASMQRNLEPAPARRAWWSTPASTRCSPGATDVPAHRDVVVVGASAGGVDSLVQARAPPAGGACRPLCWWCCTCRRRARACCPASWRARDGCRCASPTRSSR